MDKIRPFLVALKTYQFWVACAVVTLICLVTWFLGAMRLKKDREEWGKEISAKYSTAKGIKPLPVSEEMSNVTAFPNTEVQKGMNDLINAGRSAIADAWRQQYQKQSDLFVWPDALPEQARNELRRLRPIEKMLTFPTPTEKEINADYLQAYRDYIKNRLPELAAKVGADWIGGTEESAGGVRDGGPRGGGPQGGGPQGGPGGASAQTAPMSDPMLQERPPIVRWNAKNQAYWQEKTTVFAGKNGNRSANNRPLTIQVLYAQEDLWILESIFDVIKKTNGEADANDLADIKEIDHIFVGKDASAGVSAAPQRNNAAAQSQSSGFGGGGGGGMGGKTLGDMSGGGGSSSDPADDRYVNKDYQTLLASEIRGAFTNRTPDNAYLAVAKRVPVRIGLQLDERALFEFLANCANAPLTIEVRQVRINRHTPGEGGPAEVSSGGGSMGGAGKGGPGGGGADKGGGGSSPASMIEGDSTSGRTADTSLVRTDNVIDVEVYGIVHIYNPVDEQRVAPVGEAAEGSGTPASPTQTPVTTTQQPALIRNDG